MQPASPVFAVVDHLGITRTVLGAGEYWIQAGAVNFRL
jgi:hypothetical protein